MAALDGALARIAANVEWLPDSAADFALDRALARAATRIAMRRHAGSTRIAYTATGPVTIQEGKNLSRLAAVIGTGGALVHAGDPGSILSAALADPAEPASLRPADPALYLDRDYLLYAVGLLAEAAPEAALKLGLRGLEPIDREDGDERQVNG